MPELIDQNTGDPVRVSDAEMPFLPQQRFAMPARVMIVSPDGEVFAAPGNDPKIRQALASGWRIEAPEETRKRETVKKYGESDIRTALEGAASSATLGLSDLLQTKLGIASPEELRGRREANPEAFAGGELVGMAASLLVPGATPARLVRALEGAAAGKVALGAAKAISAPIRGVEHLSALAGKEAQAAAKVLIPVEAGSTTMARMLSEGSKLASQGVVDGALFGTGQLVSEHALGDTQLNAERIMSHIGTSALLSGALGGTLGSVIGVASPAAQAARKKLFDNLGNIPGISKKASAEWLKEQSHRAALASVGSTTKMFRDLEKQGLMDIGPEVFLDLKSPIDGKKILQPGMQFDKISNRLTEATDTIGQDIGATIKAVDAVGQHAGISAPQIKKRIEKNVLGPYKKQIGITSARNAVDQVLGELGELGEEQVTHRWLQDMRGNLRMAYTGNPDIPAKEALRKVERELNNILEESLSSKLSANDFADFKRKKDIFHSIKTIEENAALRAHTMEGNRFFSLSDRITGGATTAAALGSALAGDEPVENVAYGLAGGLAAQAVARQLRTRGPSVLAVFLSKASRMMSTEAAIKAAQHSESSAIKQAVEGILDSRGKPLADKIRTSSTYTDIENIRKLADNPSSIPEVHKGIQEALGDVAPEMAAAISNRLVTGMSYLASKYPRSPDSETPGLTPHARPKWQPSQAQMAMFNRYADAFDNPTSVLNDLANGRINAEGLEVLKTVYPSLRNEFVLRIIEDLSKSKTSVPYNKRVMLAVLLGIPNADPTLVPSYITAMQAGFKKQLQEPQQQSRPVTASASKSIAKIGQQNMTSTERIQTETY